MSSFRIGYKDQETNLRTNLVGRDLLDLKDDSCLDEWIQDAVFFAASDRSGASNVRHSIRAIKHITSYLETTPRGSKMFVSGPKLAELLNEAVGKPLVRMHKKSKTQNSPKMSIQQFLDQLAAYLAASEANQELETVTVDGVVDAFRSGDAVVILDMDGHDEKRLMSSTDLQTAGVHREGTSFRLCMKKLSIGGKIITQTWVEPVGDPEDPTTVNIRPHLDLDKFKQFR